MAASLIAAVTASRDMASSVCTSIVTSSVTHTAFLRVTVRISEYSLKTEHLISTVAVTSMTNVPAFVLLITVAACLVFSVRRLSHPDLCASSLLNLHSYSVTLFI